MNLRAIGAVGEEIAENYLKKQGYKIIEKNYHASRFSEIDIIARHNKMLVFVEENAHQPEKRLWQRSRHKGQAG